MVKIYAIIDMKIAIASGKGGTGKTTLAVNLACYLAEKQDVILVDMDVEEPNSGLFLNDKEHIIQKDQYYMAPQWHEVNCTLCQLCQEVCRYHAIIQIRSAIMTFPELCHGCYACSELCPNEALPMVPSKMGVLNYYTSRGLHVVESKLDVGQERTTQLIAQTHDFVNYHIPPHDMYIYDAPPGTSCPVIETVKEADFIILVTEPTPFGLHDLKLAVDTVRLLDKAFGVVVNRCGIGNEDVLNYCTSEDIRVMARIPHDRRIAELYSKGAMIYPEVTEMARQMEQLSGDLINEFELS